MSVGVVWTPLWTWLALLRSRHPRWSISFKGSRVRGNPYRGAVRMYVSPDGMHANSQSRAAVTQPRDVSLGLLEGTQVQVWMVVSLLAKVSMQRFLPSASS